MPTGHTRFAVVAVVALAATLAACGEPEQQAAGAQPIPAPATSDDTSMTTTEPTPSTTGTPTTAPTTAPTADAECATDRRTIEVALEAYYAQTGGYPADETALVTEQFLRVELATYDVVADTGEIVRVAGVPCDEPTEVVPDETGTAGEPLTADELLTDLGPEGVQMLGGTECATELSEIAAAASRFEAREGREPDDLDELSADLEVVPVLWGFDTDRQEVVPAPGSPCPDFAAETATDEQAACAVERRTLEVAREAYIAQYSDPVEPTEADLVTAGLLRAESASWNLVDGIPRPEPGGPCD